MMRRRRSSTSAFSEGIKEKTIYMEENNMEKVCFKTKKGPAALGPYSTATIYGGVIYLSGMIGVNPQTGKAPEGGTLAQAAQACSVNWARTRPTCSRQRFI